MLLFDLFSFYGCCHPYSNYDTEQIVEIITAQKVFFLYAVPFFPGQYNLVMGIFTLLNHSLQELELPY